MAREEVHSVREIFIGRLANREQLQKLIRVVDSKNPTGRAAAAASFKFSMTETEEIEFSLEYITLERALNAERIVNNRKHHVVYEDHD